MTDQAIENIKKQTEKFYSTENEVKFYQERLISWKSTIIREYKKYKNSYPDKSFEDFKNLALKDLQIGNSEGHPLMLTLGIYLNAFDGITSADLD
jgi:hypothetical protein